MTLLMTMLIYGKHRIMAMLYTIALSIGFYGLKGAIFVVNTGGAGQVKGPEGSFIDGNTFIGLGTEHGYAAACSSCARGEKALAEDSALYDVRLFDHIRDLHNVPRGVSGSWRDHSPDVPARPQQVARPW